MFLGFDDSLKRWKKELKDAGVNMTEVRQWQKSYDKVKTQSLVLEKQYTTAKEELETVLQLLLDMKQKLIGANRSRETMAHFSKELKKYQGHFRQEFLVSAEDAEFHSTYEGILRQCEKDMNEKQNVLILQSEIENLIAVTKEALERKWPDFRALAFFYIAGADSEIAQLTHADKMERVHKIYETEFLTPFSECLNGKIAKERIKKIMEEELW